MFFLSTKRSYLLRSVFSLLSLFLSTVSAAHAQHQGHSMERQGQPHVMSMPANDEVLMLSPEAIRLHFNKAVRLVKLVVKDPAKGKDGLDIGFRYSGELSTEFSQPLPLLGKADYYRVEWAAFDARQNLIKGEFYFAFGPDAKPPSYYLDQLQHPLHIMSPDYRLL